ncbi:MAG: hypothetical protein AAF495_04570 [Pseudomonadota bacterium]
MRGFIIVPMILIFGAVAAEPHPLKAQELQTVTITGIKTPKLFIFRDANNSKPDPVSKDGALGKITEAKCCNNRMMVQVWSNDPKYQGFVLKQHLTLDEPRKKLTAGCNQSGSSGQVAAAQVGSSRGLGEGCN